MKIADQIRKTVNSTKQKEELDFYCQQDLKGRTYWVMPVDIEEFVLSNEYLNLGRTIRPQVLQDLKDLFCDKESFAFCPYDEAVFDEAIGTGKSYKTSVIIAYYLYHLLCLENPQRLFNLDGESMMTIMNMSINAMQARKVVFGEIKNRLLNSRWFNAFPPDPRIQSELRFANNITIIPGHSGELFPLGYNLICAVMDEAAFYTETKTHDVAEDMFYTLKRRIQSRFGDEGLLIMISSPRYVDDFIERKMKEARSDKAIFCRRHAIWEVVPEDIKAIQEGNTFELNEEKIPKKYEKDFIKNPEKAWRDLGAKPSLSLEPYFKQWDLVEKCIDKEMEAPFNKAGQLSPNFKGKEGRRYYIHVDLGLVHDACGLAMGHYSDGITYIDLMMRIKPERNVEVDILEVLEFIKGLKNRGFHLSRVTYDQFQSASSIQALRKLGFRSDKCSVEGLEAYETMKEQIYQNKVKYYRFAPFLEELRRLELVKGKAVDHPVHGSKDVADAVCGVVFNIVKYEQNRRKATLYI